VRIRPIALLLALVVATVTELPARGAEAAPCGSTGCGRPASAGVTTRHVTVDGAVALYRIVSGGHTWPGSVPVRATRLGSMTPSISATTLILDFFDAHPRVR
jgi:poly(3-hydroxybutyrate) depolymerase